MDKKNKKRQLSLFQFLTLIAILIFVAISIANKITNSIAAEKNEKLIGEETKIEEAKNEKTEVEKVKEEPIEYEVETVIEYEIGEKLSEHSITNWGSYGGRNVNLAVACNTISGEEGRIMKPGEEFNWFEVIGEATHEKGYELGGILINGGQHAVAYGGGICQVASTLNSIAIKAGLETQALKHSKKPSYLGPNDYEATVAYGSKNFRFTNTFDYPILVKMWAEDNTVYGELYKVNEREYTVFHEIK